MNKNVFLLRFDFSKRFPLSVSYAVSGISDTQGGPLEARARASLRARARAERKQGRHRGRLIVHIYGEDQQEQARQQRAQRKKGERGFSGGRRHCRRLLPPIGLPFLTHPCITDSLPLCYGRQSLPESCSAWPIDRPSCRDLRTLDRVRRCQCDCHDEWPHHHGYPSAHFVWGRA